MDDMNWHRETWQFMEKIVREGMKQRLLVRAQERWREQVPNEIGAAAMIRGDRDAESR